MSFRQATYPGIGVADGVARRRLGGCLCPRRGDGREAEESGEDGSHQAAFFMEGA